MSVRIQFLPSRHQYALHIRRGFTFENRDHLVEHVDTHTHTASPPLTKQHGSLWQTLTNTCFLFLHSYPLAEMQDAGVDGPVTWLHVLLDFFQAQRSVHIGSAKFNRNSFSGFG